MKSFFMALILVLISFMPVFVYATPKRIDYVSETAKAPLNGLIGYWKLNEGTGSTTADNSRNGHTGTLSVAGGGGSAPTWTSGKYGNALTFSQNGVSIAMPSVFNTGAPFTITAWVYPTGSLSGTGAIWGCDTCNSGGIEFRNNAGKLDLVNEGTADLCSTSSSVLTLNTWQFVVVTAKSSGCSFFVGPNQLAFSQSASVSFGGGGNVYIGAAPGVTDYWSGKIDEVHFYNRALSAAEISVIFRATGL